VCLVGDVAKRLDNVWMEEEKEKIEELKNLEGLLGAWDSVRQDLVDARLRLLVDYRAVAEDVESLASLAFKPTSVQRFQDPNMPNIKRLNHHTFTEYCTQGH